MPELTLHFETDQGTDIHPLAAEVQQGLQAIEGVTSAKAKATELRAAGPAEILAVINVAITVVQNTSTLLKAVDDLVKAWHDLSARFHGLKKPSVEIGLREVPIDQVTPQDLLEALSE
ncbi:MAG: hypothetical protein JOZ29_04760 [Deltaproteobacteria bacterium]|nr:hypothetical protein [Deltaproteobacteria bacterium]MBV8451567.1 hypothetical protein [Deltaproteobacteria bacterium]